MGFAAFLAEGADAAVGRVLMKTASTNEIHLRVYVAEELLLKRTDTLVIELSAGSKDDGKTVAKYYQPENTCFTLTLRDSDGKLVERTSEGIRRLLDLTRDRFEGRSAQGMAPFRSGRFARTERFNLGELYVLQEGKTYTLHVHTEVKRGAAEFGKLEMLNVPIKMGIVPP